MIKRKIVESIQILHRRGSMSTIQPNIIQRDSRYNIDNSYSMQKRKRTIFPHNLVSVTCIWYAPF